MKRAIVIIFLIASFTSMSQFPEYYVYLVKGEVFQRKPNGRATAVKQKSLLYKSDEVTLKRDAAVTLVNSQQQNLVLSTAGIYKVAELMKRMHTNNTGLAKKYLSLVWLELLNSGVSRKETLAANWGGLSTRGDLCNNRIFPVNGLKTAADSLHFRWLATSPSRSYTLRLLDGGGTEIMNQVISDTQALLPVNQIVKNKGGKFYWLVKSNDGACEDEVPFYFDVLSKEEEAKLVEGLLSPSTGEEVIDRLQVIDRLEKQALIYEALAYFRNLVNDQPGNKPLKRSYAAFLMKYGFEDEAKLLWSD